MVQGLELKVYREGTEKDVSEEDPLVWGLGFRVSKCAAVPRRARIEGS